MAAWGWRVPFLASALLLLVGLAIRLGVNESPEFIASREQAETARRKEQAPARRAGTVEDRYGIM